LNEGVTQITLVDGTKEKCCRKNLKSKVLCTYGIAYPHGSNDLVLTFYLQSNESIVEVLTNYDFLSRNSDK
jgi:hypothetical protein